jgi:hypothetical protein
MSDHALHGTWQLTSLFAESFVGEKFYPYGDAPNGMLMYNPNSTMAVVLMRRGRAKFAGGDVYGATPAELKEAFEGFDAYCGTYTIDEQAESVIHHVEASRFPNWEGSDLKRYYRHKDDELILTSEPMHALGQDWVVHVVWRRRS